MTTENRNQRLAREIVRQLIAPHEARVVLFGSRARGDARTYSDIDLAVFPRGELPPARLSALREAFEESSLLVDVDVVDMRSADPCLAEAVEREGQVWIA